MAKRQAEALAFRAPRHLLPRAPLPKRPRGDLEPRCAALWLEGGRAGGGGCKKRKREGTEGRGWGGGDGEDGAAGDGKRPVVAAAAAAAGESRLPTATGRGLGGTPAEGGAAARWEGMAAAEVAASAGGDLAGCRSQKPPEENEDDVWRYNSFEYWRCPLPTINLSDILDLENDNTVDERDSCSTGLSEMET